MADSSVSRSFVLGMTVAYSGVIWVCPSSGVLGMVDTSRDLLDIHPNQTPHAAIIVVITHRTNNINMNTEIKSYIMGTRSGCWIFRIRFIDVSGDFRDYGEPNHTLFCWSGCHLLWFGTPLLSRHLVQIYIPLISRDCPPSRTHERFLKSSFLPSIL